MKKTAKSLGHSIDGLIHAIRIEKNIQKFIGLHIVIMVAGVFLLRVDVFFLLMTMIPAGFFLTVELLNTALERLSDTVDDIEKKARGGNLHAGIKQTKDVAAAASLIALLVYCVIIILLSIPYIIEILYPF